jgi:hypothetical protein
MALLTTGTAPSTRALDPARIRAELARRAASTPGRLTVLMAVLALLGLLTGVAAVVGSAQRSALVDAVANRSGPLAVQVQQLYRSLSDADATAAAAFLSSGAEPAALRERYQADIAAASAALAAVTVTNERQRAQVATIAASLPVYTGLVETARSYNRLNLPVGAAYLREASGLMRQQLLPAAKTLYGIETGSLAADRAGAAEFPWVTVPLILVMLAGLIVAQVYLVRRTRRLVNVGLAAATAAGLVFLAWVTVSWVGAAAELGSSNRDGSAQLETIAQARIAALQARADEALTLVARGSGGAFEQDFTRNMAALAGDDGRGGLLAVARGRATDPAVRGALAAATTAVSDWRKVHAQLRERDDGGHYPDAVKLAIGGESTTAASAFNRLDGQLATAIASASKTFDERAGAAGGALTATGVGWVILALMIVTGLVLGLQQRIAEYR